MTASDDPWEGLTTGGKDARRVDQNGRHDYFWIVSGNLEPGLMLQLGEGVEEQRPLPRMRSIDLGYRDVGSRKALVVVLKDLEQKELFASLCQDIVRAGENAADNQDALTRSVRRTLRWHHLLRGGKTSLLSIEEQRGLLGELQFLSRLVELIGPRAAIEAWKGPSGSSKDFELDGCLIEIKARRGAAKPYVQISSEDQLADVADCRLFLVVSAIDAAIKPNGKTLTDHALDVEKLFSMADPEAYSLWEEAIEASGFSFDDDYSERRWTVGKSTEFEVLDGFPRIAMPIAIGVSSVRYSVSLEACAPFSIDPRILNDLISEGMAHG
ncbi:PD-(D/E)XK motif protein [Rhizorhabdus histidinilytica]|uniref:Putative PD-(D/E)XK family member n=1 Tax=Rhizorhabdus histidinilytica TaxID=439228 RepID=A0A1T5FQ23_9SPHN|nr:PD-(D/E)XK motif protein [Rhizorhabdus histidinilytica]SKB98253.1 Putative PD-(D/E)XK family member [Rhizorhabdus histidinilytica]